MEKLLIFFVFADAKLCLLPYNFHSVFTVRKCLAAEIILRRLTAPVNVYCVRLDWTIVLIIQHSDKGKVISGSSITTSKISKI